MRSLSLLIKSSFPSLESLDSYDLEAIKELLCTTLCQLRLPLSAKELQDLQVDLKIAEDV
jgi:hypothetical protein